MELRQHSRADLSLGLVTYQALNYRSAVAQIDALAHSNRPHLVLTPNIAHIYQASKDSAVASAYKRASLCTPDGWPLVLALRLLGARSVQRVTGSDLTPMLCRGKYRVALIGGKENSADEAGRALRSMNPLLDVVLTEAAPQRDLANQDSRDALLMRIALSGADLIFIGLPSPKQEQIALQLLDRLPSGVILCVGASIEFAAGTTPRSPRAMQTLHLEWLYRLLLEPKRLFTRYATSSPYFVLQLAKAIRREVKVAYLPQIRKVMSRRAHEQHQENEEHR